MKNFIKIGNVDISPLLEELENTVHLWGHTPERASYNGSAHKDTDCIILRGNSSRDITKYQEEIESDWWIASLNFPYTVRFIEMLSKAFGFKEVGKVMFTTLYPKSSISEHVDEGSYSDHFDRMHIPLITSDKVVFKCGAEQISMKEGEIFVFNHKLPHSVTNDGNHERFHLVIDYRR